MIHERRVIGYVLSRPGANARQIGPCVATPGSGPRLIADALQRHATLGVYVDVPLDNQPAAAVAQRTAWASRDR